MSATRLAAPPFRVVRHARNRPADERPLPDAPSAIVRLAVTPTVFGRMPMHPTARGLHNVSVLQMQQTHGNRHVQRLLHWQPGPLVQRCGATPCGCSSEERIRHAREQMPEAIAAASSSASMPVMRQEAPAIQRQSIQRGWFDDEEDAGAEATGSSAWDWASETAGGVMDWAGEQAGGAVEWGQEQGSGAVDWTSEQAGGVIDWGSDQVEAAGDWAVETAGAAGEWLDEQEVAVGGLMDAPAGQGWTSGGAESPGETADQEQEPEMSQDEAAAIVTQETLAYLGNNAPSVAALINPHPIETCDDRVLLEKDTCDSRVEMAATALAGTITTVVVAAAPGLFKILGPLAGLLILALAKNHMRRECVDEQIANRNTCEFFKKSGGAAPTDKTR